MTAGSTNHRGIDYAALAANDVIRKLHYLAFFVDTNEDTRRIWAEADNIAASILSGEPTEEDREFITPHEYDKLHRQAGTRHRQDDLRLLSIPRADGTDMNDIGHDLPCRLCAMKSSPTDTGMGRMPPAARIA